MKTSPRDDMSANNANLGDFKRVHDDLMLNDACFVKRVFPINHIFWVDLSSSPVPVYYDRVSIVYNPTRNSRMGTRHE